MKKIYAHLNWYLYKNTYEIFDNLWNFVSQGIKSAEIFAAEGCFHKNNDFFKLTKQKQLGLGQICGLTYQKDKTLNVKYLGSFINDDRVKPGYYRSIIVSRKNIEIKEKSLIASINQKDSYSGRFALYSFFNDNFLKPNFKKEIYSGSHLDTINLISKGDADIGAIDYLCWQMMKEMIPNKINNLHVLGYSKKMPSPPLICSNFENLDIYEYLKDKLYNVFKDRELKQKLSSIGIIGIKELKLKDYELFNPLKI